MKFTSIIFALLILSSCKKDETIVAQERPVSSFNKIVLKHRINLILTQGSTNALTVVAAMQKLSSIKTEVIDDVLYIENLSNNIINKPGESINIYLHVSGLETIDYQGSGNITSTNTITAPTFTIVSMTGAGIIDLDVEANHLVAGIYEDNADIILSGRSNTAYVYCTSRGSIDLRNMEVKNLDIIYSSVRNGYVWATETLNGTIYHKGNVFYKGNPQVNQTILSEGKFLPL